MLCFFPDFLILLLINALHRKKHFCSNILVLPSHYSEILLSFVDIWLAKFSFGKFHLSLHGPNRVYISATSVARRWLYGVVFCIFSSLNFKLLTTKLYFSPCMKRLVSEILTYIRIKIFHI